ncbi:Uncharacterised protein [Mycobacterium tuberculosis]|uniref:Uncharacterized protein n=1 Tax=Mycobacterium tuberculosis TaxID=1773 RepID=A0A654U4Y0_MYCTX|nr:Uncharacterised protein [Mycobacterium tuberculosis]CFS35699.1 Uncharacterised protein [Mycobacterium tuberculosis]
MPERAGFWDPLTFLSGGDKDLRVVFVMVHGFVIRNDLSNYPAEFDELPRRRMDVF